MGASGSARARREASGPSQSPRAAHPFPGAGARRSKRPQREVRPFEEAAKAAQSVPSCGRRAVRLGRGLSLARRSPGAGGGGQPLGRAGSYVLGRGLGRGARNRAGGAPSRSSCRALGLNWLGGGYRCLCPQLVQELLFVFLGKSSLEPRNGSHLERMQPAVQPGDVSVGAFGKQRGLGRPGGRRTRDA